MVGETLIPVNDAYMIEAAEEMLPDIQGDPTYPHLLHGMATVYQSVSPLMDSFLKLIDDDSIILGWGDGDGCGEDNLGTIAARNGVMCVASDWASNLSVLAAVEPKAVYSQCTESDPTALVTENKHYITFIWTKNCVI